MRYIIHLTNQCNLACTYCYEKKRRRQGKAVFSIRAMKVLYERMLEYQRARKDRTIEITFTGGEVLTVPPKKWESYLNLQKEIFPKSYRIINTIQTNLYRLTDRMLRFIKDNKIHVGSSFDFSGKTRLTKQGKDSSDRVFCNLRRLRKNGIPFGLVCVVTNYNIDNMLDIYDYMVENGINFHFFPCHRAASVRKDHYIKNPKRYAHNLYKVIERYVRDTKTNIQFGDAISYSSMVLNNSDEELLCQYAKCCGESFSIFKPNGDVFVCDGCAYDEYKLGNYFHEDLVSMLSPSNPVRRMFRERADKAAGINRLCRACKWKRLCNRGCPWDSINEGDFYKRSKLFCAMNKIILPRLTKLYQAMGIPTKIAL